MATLETWIERKNPIQWTAKIPPVIANQIQDFCSFNKTGTRISR